LQMSGRMTQHQRAQRPRLANDGSRGDEITEPKSRKKRFGEAAHIENATILVERFQRRGRWLEKAHLEFVIVLDDDEISFRRRFQQRDTPRPGHGGGCGGLMTWRNEDRVNPVRQKFGRQAAFIDIKCRNAGSRQMERSADIRMARILAYDMRTPRQKQMAD